MMNVNFVKLIKIIIMLIESGRNRGLNNKPKGVKPKKKGNNGNKRKIC